MGEQPAIDEIREEESQPDTDDDPEPTGDDSGMFGGSMPSLGLSRKQLLFIGLLVVAAIAWRLRSSGSNDSGSASNSKAAEEIEAAKNPDLSGVKVREEEDADEAEIVVPKDPENPLDQDRAVIEHFKEVGHISGGEDD